MCKRNTNVVLGKKRKWKKKTIGDRLARIGSLGWKGMQLLSLICMPADGKWALKLALKWTLVNASEGELVISATEVALVLARMQH